MRFSGVIIMAASVACFSLTGACVLDSSGIFGGATSTGGAGGSGGGTTSGGTGGQGGTTTSSGGTGGQGGTTTSSGGTGGQGGTTTSSGGTGGQGGSTTSSGGTGGTGGSGGGPGCSTTGDVVFDPSMPCYKMGIYQAGAFLPPPDSSDNTATCESGTCGNSPVPGDFEVLWVQETFNQGKFTSVNSPASFSARCTAYTAAAPPTMDQLKNEMVQPSGWFMPNVTNVGQSYTLTAPSCAGGSVMYTMHY